MRAFLAGGFAKSLTPRRRTLENGRSVPSRREAFSLTEMMIAIVLLGLGMIMIATMFPVAWTRARQLNEITNFSTVVAAADTTVRMLARVDGRNVNAGTFAGDLIFLRGGDCLIPTGNLGDVFMASDTRVHALSMDNVLVSPRKFLASERWNQWPWSVARIDRLINPGVTVVDLHANCEELVTSLLFTSPQVRFEARLHPPVRARSDVDFSVPDAEWDELVNSRRYAWALLHRLRAPVETSPGDLVDSYNHADDRREFDLFYVMFRRPQSTYRYAQQDPRSTPDVVAATPEQPRALPPDRDVLLPEPWRVQVYFPDPFGPATPTNLPTEVQVNYPGPAVTDRILVDLFPPGAFFIDEESGLILQVAKRRIVENGPNGPYSTLTLDREILPNDLGTPENLRTVWVFPPPVQPQRVTDGVPIFEGVQPVVAIEQRTLLISPVN